MSQKNSAPKIKFTGIKDGENDVYITLDNVARPNAAGRRYDPQALYKTVRSPSFNRRAFTISAEEVWSREELQARYLNLMHSMPVGDRYRGTPAQRHPFMRTMALRFGMAMQSAKLGSQRQTGKANMFYAQLTNFHNHYLDEMKWIKANKPIPIDLTRYLKLITGKDVWNPMPVWFRDVPSYFQPDDVMRAGVGKSLLYNMMPSVKLHLAGIHATLGGRPWIYDSNCMGPAGFWPATIEYGMASDGPAMTAQLNRERLTKPKKGRV